MTRPKVWRHRSSLLLLVLVLASPVSRAQSDWARVAVPAYSPVHLLQGLHTHWTWPRAQAFVAAAAGLTQALQAHCSAPAAGGRALSGLQAARQHWRHTVTAWERLSAVATGPLLQRRSQRQIDFQPTRATLIDKAVSQVPQGPDALERVGAPAKGLPALEWLLWTRPVVPGQAACSYALELARDVEREAQALHDGFAALALRPAEDWTEVLTRNAVEELLNQWVGGLERLRWAQMDKPLRAGRPAELPRAASGTTLASWQAQWSAIQALARFAGAAAPAPGQGLVPLETYLRGQGLNPLADQLARAVDTVNATWPRTVPRQPAQTRHTSRALAQLKQLGESALAPALDVRIGFSDADGD